MSPTLTDASPVLTDSSGRPDGLQVLERGNLVISLKEGRERLLWFNPVPIQLIHERWSSEYGAYWSARLTRLQRAAESAELHPFPSPKKKGR